jgi:threonyl-tRNA synthetase
VELQRVSRVACLTLFLTYYSLLTQVLDLTERILTKFGFMKYEIMLSTRPEKAVGSDEIWEQACMYAHAVRI